jgi:folate-dependent phosphoribosylglycinamide formyltransferase PurN
MKIVLLCGPEPNQMALANKISAVVKLAEIIVCQPNASKLISLRSSLLRMWQVFCTLVTGLRFRASWFGMLRYYKNVSPEFPITPSIFCRDINEIQVLSRIAELKADLVVVSGTNLLRNPIIAEIRRYGVAMNLHTGISPYIKGGPNCTNWCLYLREFWLIGNSVMWIDAGIDSGNLICTERTILNGSESLMDLHISVMEHAHEIYVKCIEKYVKGETLPNIPQDGFGTRRLFLSRHWDMRQMLVALFNFYFYFRRGSNLLSAPDGINLVDLEIV